MYSISLQIQIRQLYNVKSILTVILSTLRDGSSFLVWRPDLCFSLSLHFLVKHSHLKPHRVIYLANQIAHLLLQYRLQQNVLSRKFLNLWVDKNSQCILFLITFISFPTFLPFQFLCCQMVLLQSTSLELSVHATVASLMPLLIHIVGMSLYIVSETSI